jgi:hypothetical protein
MSKRIDARGLFWHDETKVKAAPKEKVVRTPPPPFWHNPDYLPGLEEARLFKPDLYNDMELYAAFKAKERLLFDIEVYPNYCLFGFKSVATGKVLMFEWHEDDDFGLPGCEKMRWVIQNFTLITFNGIFYDIPITTLALAGFGPEHLWEATKQLIVHQMRPHEVLKSFKVNRMYELTALRPGLKVCAGRLHAPRLQDLPFKPGTILTPDQITIIRAYNINDLDNTAILYKSVLPQIEIRESQGVKYKVDLRSESDAQMAEAIIGAEIKRISGRKFIPRTKLPDDTSYKFKTPDFIRFDSPLMQWVLTTIQKARFYVDNFTGALILPESISAMDVKINNGKYKFGLGGLHSQEKKIAHYADDKYFIVDTDATSYYPRLILNAGLMPSNLGRDFLVVYDGIVVDRVTAKMAGDVVVAECLKIVVNGTFGKLGSKWSIVYAPNLLLQTTITGQLSIAMLVERFEMQNIEVISVNTDGIIVKCLRSKEDVFKSIIQQWEKETGFGTEEMRYKAVYSKDINNYIAVYETPQKGKLFKTKGLYAETNPKKNAVNEICIEAIKQYLSHGTPLDHTIRACTKISMFTSMRSADGGAVKMFDENTGIYLGKVIRWYYATGEQGEIISAKTGNRIARTENAKPVMDLPKEFPNDIDYEWYIAEAGRILTNIGVEYSA